MVAEERQFRELFNRLFAASTAIRAARDGLPNCKGCIYVSPEIWQELLTGAPLHYLAVLRDGWVFGVRIDQDANLDRDVIEARIVKRF